MLVLLVAAFLFQGTLEANAGDVSTFSPFDHLRNEYKISNGRSVYVFDGAVPEQHLMALNMFMSANDNWRYVLHDPHAAGKDRLYDDGNGIPWKSWKAPVPLKSTAVGTKLKSLVQAVDARSQDEQSANFEINEIYAALMRRGDRTKIHRETELEESAYSVAIFNNIVWRKNAYGELLFYDDDGEIVACVRPKFGRVVVWQSSISYVFRPPSIAQLTTQSITFVQFSANVTKNAEKAVFYQNFVRQLKNPPLLTSWLEDIPQKAVTDEDVKSHLTLLRKNRENHFVAVFDDLFDKATLSALRSWTIKYGLYFFDGTIDIGTDNVQWIAAISVDTFVKTEFWPIIHKVAKFVSNTSEWYPYDVACNLIRSYDHTRFHLDTSHAREKEMTFLLYLSPNWTAADYGETAFMETNDDHPRNEYVAEVVPRYGRAVIFDGNFPHSAHPPAVTHYNARYTLAVKLSYTKLLAVKKTFSEEMRHEPFLTHALSEIEKLAHAPEVAVANQKIASVAEHLNTRNVIMKMSSSGNEEEDEDRQQMGEEADDEGEHEDDERDEHEEEEEDERRDSKSQRKSKDEEDFYSERGERPEIAGFDSAQIEEYVESLTKPQQKMLEAMINHHRLGEKMSAISKEKFTSSIDYSIFDPEAREGLIMKWQKSSGRNGDVLNDYLELYLRQCVRQKEGNSKKMLALL